MERKYYLRGLGLGIAVTAVIMGMVLPGSRTMTNDEIIARAKELGMVENTVLADADSEAAPQENMDESSTARQSEIQDNAADVDDIVDGEDIDDEETDLQAESSDVDEEDDTPLVAADEEDDTIPVTADEEDDTIPTTADDREVGEIEKPNGSIPTSAARVITINSGDGSYTVAKKLEDAGVVTSAANFDSFLCENGYDKRLRTGNFSIPADASDEQIARIVTGAE